MKKVMLGVIILSVLALFFAVSCAPLGQADASTSVCGNRKLEAGEVCDQLAGCALSGLDKCQKCSDGFRLGNPALPQGICVPICGDGKIKGGEECDTNNIINGRCESCRIMCNIGFSEKDNACAASTIVDSILQSCPTKKEIAMFNADFKIESVNPPVKPRNPYECVDGKNPNYPADRRDPKLTVYQALRIMKAMNFSRPLPWTKLSLYDWLKSSVTGVQIDAYAINSRCCSDNKMIIIKEDVLKSWTNNYWVEPRTGTGISGLIELFSHEARHRVRHHNCEKVTEADDNSIKEMGAWAIQYYIENWMTHYLPDNFQSAYERQVIDGDSKFILAQRFCKDNIPEYY